MNRAMRRAAVSNKFMRDRSVIRVDRDRYLHYTKGYKKVTRYEKLQEAGQILRAMGSR